MRQSEILGRSFNPKKWGLTFFQKMDDFLSFQKFSKILDQILHLTFENFLKW
jgi:hypothetical protein